MHGDWPCAAAGGRVITKSYLGTWAPVAVTEGTRLTLLHFPPCSGPEAADLDGAETLGGPA